MEHVVDSYFTLIYKVTKYTLIKYSLIIIVIIITIINNKLKHNKPDLVILTKKEKTAHIGDVGCPFDTRIKERERTKIERYTDLKYELLKVWKGEITKVFILRVIIGALGTMTKHVQDNLDKLKRDSRIWDLQKGERITKNVKDPKGGPGLVTCHQYAAGRSMMSGATGVRPSKCG